MNDSLEIPQRISKHEFELAEAPLRVDLLNAQFDLKDAGFNIVLVLAGNDDLGCNEVLNLLNAWLDARRLRTHAFGPRSDEERAHPYFWRFWRAMPQRGRIGVFLHAWTFSSIAARLNRAISRKELKRRLGHINDFERLLVDDGTLLLKFWLRLPESALRRRLKQHGKGDDVLWPFSKRERKVFEDYDRSRKIAEHVIGETNTPAAPWRVIDSTHRRGRNLLIMRALHEALAARLDESSSPASIAVSTTVCGFDDADATAQGADAVNVLDSVDLTAKLDDDTYDRRLRRLQAELAKLSRRAREKGVASVLVFEGWDAAGKGGAIRRMTAAMDARNYRVVPIAAPTQEELAQHYLWRFWRQLPRTGCMTVFDRSWYGRVLVERVEGFATESAWRRAYGEINNFERQLCEQGVVVAKFWLHIDQAEQLRRFAAREQTPYKKYKITGDDYRNRQKWPEYRAAVHDMVQRTSTEDAPWRLIAANDKRWARIQVLESVCRSLGQHLER